jgi:hypothetical protein
MMEVNELMIERDTLETKGIETLNENELDNYYMISDRIRELIGGTEDVQRKIERSLERRFGRRF